MHARIDLAGPSRTEVLESRVATAADPAARLEARLDLACWLADADPRSALPHADAALADALALGDPALEARAGVVRAHARLFAVSPRVAHDELAEARGRYVALGDRVGVARADLLAGIALEYLGDPGGATVRTERALATFRDEGVVDGEARALNNLGFGQVFVGRHEEALTLFQRVADLGTAAGDPVTAGLGRLNAAEVGAQLGVKAAEDGKVEDARIAFVRSLDALRAVAAQAVRDGHRVLEPVAMAYQVVPMIGLGRAAEAVRVGEQAIARAGALELDDAAAPSLHLTGAAHLADGDLDRAASRLERALALYEQWDLIHETAAVLRLLVEAHERRGDIPTAFALHKRLLATELRLRDLVADREDQVAAARYEAEREMEAAERGRRQLLQLARANRRLTVERRAMERLAQTDGLTELANRRHFDAQLARLLVQAELTGEQLSLVLVDVDHFKDVNDRHSHPVGDAVLRLLAAEVARHCRVSDLAARVGGEEFAVLLPTTTAAEARMVAERLRASVAALDLSGLAAGLRVTLSAGVAASAPGMSPDALVAAADAALYAAKHGGRNRVRAARTA